MCGERPTTNARRPFSNNVRRCRRRAGHRAAVLGRLALLHRQPGAPVFGATLQIDLGALADERLVAIPARLAVAQRLVLRPAAERHEQALRLAALLEVGHFGLAFVRFGELTHDLRDEHLFLDFAQLPVVRIAWMFFVCCVGGSAEVLVCYYEIWLQKQSVGLYQGREDPALRLWDRGVVPAFLRCVESGVGCCGSGGEPARC